jgi:hypothetical protein
MTCRPAIFLSVAIRTDRTIRGKMSPVTMKDEAARLAHRYSWWQEPQDTLAELEHLLCHIMGRATPEDYTAALRLWGRERFRAALEHALAGWMDDRSWYFWRRHFQLPEIPPPARRFDATGT